MKTASGLALLTAFALLHLMACHSRQKQLAAPDASLNGHWLSQPGWSTIQHEQNPHPALPYEGLLELAIDRDSALWVNNGFEQAHLKLVTYTPDSIKVLGMAEDTSWLVRRNNKLYLCYSNITHVFEQVDTAASTQSRMEWYMNNQFLAGTWHDTATSQNMSLNADGKVTGSDYDQYRICIGGDCYCNYTELVGFTGKGKPELLRSWERKGDTLKLYEALLTTLPDEKPCYKRGKLEKIYLLWP